MYILNSNYTKEEMTSTTSMKSASDHKELITEVDRRETIVKNYVAIINPANREPMLQLRTSGDCTIADPRAHLDHQLVLAKRVCCTFIHISLPYLHSLVCAGLINNNTRIVCRDVGYDEYQFAQLKGVEAVNNATSTQSVDHILTKARRRGIEGQCQPSSDILGPKYDVLPWHKAKIKKRNRDGSRPKEDNPWRRLNRQQWETFLKNKNKDLVCWRDAEGSDAIRRNNMRALLGGLCDGKQVADDIIEKETILIVEANWWPGDEPVPQTNAKY